MENLVQQFIRPALHKGIDWTGKRLDCSTVLGQIGTRKVGKNNTKLWLIQCDCGNVRESTYMHIVKGTASLCSICSAKRRAGKHHYKWQGGKHIPKSFLTHIENRRKRGNGRVLECNLTIDFLDQLWEKQDGKCAYTGQVLTVNKGYGGTQTASIDRKDSSIGYVQENVQFVHKDINKMKQDLTHSEFIRLCGLVVR